MSITEIPEGRLTPDTLRELLAYDPDTGALTWRERDRHHFKTDADHKRWNAGNAGNAAGSRNSSGYLQVTIFGRHRHLAHVLAWAIQTGHWPERQVDHINHVPDDNRWENLRETTPEENMRNLGRRKKSSTSTVAGVYFDKRLGKWRAQIREDKQLRGLGTFDTEEEAIRARKAAEIALGYHPNHGADIANGDPPLFGNRIERWTDEEKEGE